MSLSLVPLSFKKSTAYLSSHSFVGICGSRTFTLAPLRRLRQRRGRRGGRRKSRRAGNFYKNHRKIYETFCHTCISSLTYETPLNLMNMRIRSNLKGTSGSLSMYESALKWRSMNNKQEVRRRVKALDVWREHGIKATITAFDISRPNPIPVEESTEREARTP